MNPDVAEIPLRDIHAAAVPPWWPPAPGWWLLALLALVAAIWIWRRLWRRFKNWRLRQALTSEYAGILSHYESSRDGRRMLAESASFLRRLLVHIGGQRSRAGVIGEAWVDHLSSIEPGNAGLRQACRDLASLAYQTDTVAVDPVLLASLVRQWIDHCVVQGQAHV